jgi:hypothetical protein
MQTHTQLVVHYKCLKVFSFEGAALVEGFKVVLTPAFE